MNEIKLNFTLEICANSTASAVIAQEGGADRIELCENLKEGGTTPSYGQILAARKALNIPLYVIIRPRGGDFLYSDLEFEIMKRDIEMCKYEGINGVAFGILNTEASPDKKRNRELLELARPMNATFHRAFDMCLNFDSALVEIIALGFERVLTSGGKPTAFAGTEVIRELVKQAAGRISIMPGSGVNEQNLLEIAELTGATEFHTTAKRPVESGIKFRNGEVVTGAGNNDYLIDQTDLQTVKNLKRILTGLAKH